MEKGTAIPYSLDKLQERGKFFIFTQVTKFILDRLLVKIHEGDDMVVNVTKTKKLSNVRSSGTDEKVKISTTYPI